MVQLPPDPAAWPAAPKPPRETEPADVAADADEMPPREPNQPLLCEMPLLPLVEQRDAAVGRFCARASRQARDGPPSVVAPRTSPPPMTVRTIAVGRRMGAS
jgi:hypothetical protein